MSVLAIGAAVTSAAGLPAAHRRPVEAARSIRAAEARRRPVGRRQPVDRPPQRRRVRRRQRRHRRHPSRDRPSSSRRANQDRRANQGRLATRDLRPNRLRSGRRSASRSSAQPPRITAPPRRNSWRSLHLQPVPPRPQEDVRVSSSGVPPFATPPKRNDRSAPASPPPGAPSSRRHCGELSPVASVVKRSIGYPTPECCRRRAPGKGKPQPNGKERLGPGNRVPSSGKHNKRTMNQPAAPCSSKYGVLVFVGVPN
jgi:hypothetical protein